jgi:hypothetical protein
MLTASERRHSADAFMPFVTLALPLNIVTDVSFEQGATSTISALASCTTQDRRSAGPSLLATVRAPMRVEVSAPSPSQPSIGVGELLPLAEDEGGPGRIASKPSRKSLAG